MCQFKPFGAKILVEIKQKQKTESGLILPKSKDKIVYAKVISIGKDESAQYGKMPSIGDTIIFERFAGIELEEDKFFIVKTQDIIGFSVNEQTIS